MTHPVPLLTTSLRRLEAVVYLYGQDGEGQTRVERGLELRMTREGDQWTGAVAAIADPSRAHGFALPTSAVDAILTTVLTTEAA